MTPPVCDDDPSHELAARGIYPDRSPLWMRRSFSLRLYLAEERTWPELNAWRALHGVTHRELVEQLSWLANQGAAIAVPIGDEDWGWQADPNRPAAPDSWTSEWGGCQEGLGGASFIGDPSRKANARLAPKARQQSIRRTVSVTQESRQAELWR